MRKGLRFQTKLALAMTAAIAVVTFAILAILAILAITERKVKQTYEHQFARYFEGQVARIEESSEERTQEFVELCETLAKTDLVNDMLKGKPTEAGKEEFSWVYGKTQKELDGKPTANPLARKNRPMITAEMMKNLGQVAVMDLSGEIAPLPILQPQQVGGRRNFAAKRKVQMRRKITKEDLVEFAKSDTRQTLYLPVGGGDGNQFVQEMVSTPGNRDPIARHTLISTLVSSAANMRVS